MTGEPDLQPPLVVAVDRSPDTRSAYLWASAEARSRHGGLRVVTYASTCPGTVATWRPEPPSPAGDLVDAAQGQTLVVSGGDPDLAVLVVRRATAPVVVVPREWQAANETHAAPVRLVVSTAASLLDVSLTSAAGAALAHARRHDAALVVHPTRTDPREGAAVVRVVEGWRRRFPTVRVSVDADRPASAERFAAHRRASLLTVIARGNRPCRTPDDLLDPRVRALLFYGRTCVMVMPHVGRTGPAPASRTGQLAAMPRPRPLATPGPTP